MDIQATAPFPTRPQTLSIWYQDFYRIRRKVLAIGTRYYIENRQGNIIGFSKQKMLRIKDDIRVYSDEAMTLELFSIRQENIVDDWGTWAVVDGPSNSLIGKMRRSYMSNFAADEYALLGPEGRQIGRLIEPSKRGLVRKYVPFGGLVPEQIKLEFNGNVIANIQQQFKIVGDTWEVDCNRLPDRFDRRTLLSAMLIMGMIERDEDRD